jgi:hypothetical protein
VRGIGTPKVGNFRKLLVKVWGLCDATWQSSCQCAVRLWTDRKPVNDLSSDHFGGPVVECVCACWYHVYNLCVGLLHVYVLVCIMCVTYVWACCMCMRLFVSCV